MRLGNTLKFAVTLILIAASIYFIHPLDKTMKLGLDLQGGTHVVLKLKETAETPIDQEAMNRVIEVVERRVNELGVTEPIVQSQGKDQVIVQLPGVKDSKQALDTIGKTALLEFKKVNPDGGLGETVLTGAHLKKAQVGYDQYQQPIISIEFDAPGSKQFGQITQESVGKPLAIVLDGKVLSAPIVQEPIAGGKAQITGNRSVEEAQKIALLLRAGALPVPVELVEIRTVGPTLGADSIAKSINAGIVGTILVVLFMLLVYRLPGLVANATLLFYILLVLAVMVLLKATLTLPGLAGLVLSIGMAVDTNILIFERFKEEVRSGKSLRPALDAGFNRAFASVIDSHTTTFITALILFWLGTGTVKGFAITLMLGIVINLFTAITVTKNILDMIVNVEAIRKIKALWAVRREESC